MIEKKHVKFEFTLSDKIPTETALEIVALRQVVMALTAALPTDTRQTLITTLAKVNTPQMNDIVENMQLIDDK